MLWNFECYRQLQNHHIRESIPRTEARDDDSDGEDPFEGLDDDDEDVDLGEFSELEEK